MGTLEEIKTHLKDQQAILLDINIGYLNLKRLEEEKYDYESKVRNLAFFQHHVYQLKFITIVQLSKLYGANTTNDKRSFYVLRRLLATILTESSGENGVNSSDVGWNCDEMKTVHDRLQTRLKTNAARIKKIIEARNKVYAHKDPTPPVQPVTFEDINALVKAANSIHNDINFQLFNTTTLFETKDWDIDPLLKSMAKLEKDRMDEIQRKRSPL
jgi:hypothetical protein